MADVISLRPGEAEVREAWDAYDAARLRIEMMYRDPTSTRTERYAAGKQAALLYDKFSKLALRAEGGR